MNSILNQLSNLDRKYKLLLVISNDFFFALVCWLVFGPPMATYIASEFSTGSQYVKFTISSCSMENQELCYSEKNPPNEMPSFLLISSNSHMNINEVDKGIAEWIKPYVSKNPTSDYLLETNRIINYNKNCKSDMLY